MPLDLGVKIGHQRPKVRRDQRRDAPDPFPIGGRPTDVPLEVLVTREELFRIHRIGSWVEVARWGAGSRVRSPLAAKRMQSTTSVLHRGRCIPKSREPSSACLGRSRKSPPISGRPTGDGPARWVRRSIPGGSRSHEYFAIDAARAKTLAYFSIAHDGRSFLGYGCPESPSAPDPDEGSEATHLVLLFGARCRVPPSRSARRHGSVPLPS